LAGAKLVRVLCARCESEYFYQLTRVGVGASQAPYYIGVGRATRKAEKLAQDDLRKRLAREAELVPCPKCHWINDELIAGYRLVRYQFLGTLAAWVAVSAAIVGVMFLVVCLIANGQAIANGKAADLVYFLIAPGGLLLFAGLVYLLQIWMRHRIQPNRDFPAAPRLPPGSPPALLRDPESGEFVRARPPSVPDIADGDWCDFQLGRHCLPQVCCDCLRPADTAHGYHAVSVVVPRCLDCELESKRAYRRVFYSVAMAGLFLSGAIVVPLNLQAEEFWIWAGVGILGTLLLAAFVASKRTAPVKIGARDRSRHVIKLRFRNPDYTRVVAQHVSQFR
jgi:hypothetical protein